MINKIFITIFLMAAIVYNTAAQGCNDAGMCSMGDLDGKALNSEHEYNTQLTYNFGLGEQQSLINTVLFEQRFPVFNKKGQIIFTGTWDKASVLVMLVWD